MKTKETELEILLLLNMIKILGIPKAAVGNIILCHPQQMINAIKTHHIKYPPIQHSLCNSKCTDRCKYVQACLKLWKHHWSIEVSIREYFVNVKDKNFSPNKTLHFYIAVFKCLNLKVQFFRRYFDSSKAVDVQKLAFCMVG